MPFPHVPSPPALFPTYLIPSLPFRRRKSSTDSSPPTSPTSSETSTSSTDTTPTQQTDTFLSGHESHLRCARCASDLALASQIISKGFQGRHGRAYLVAPTPSSLSSTNHPATPPTSRAKGRIDTLPNLPNTYSHKPVPRQLVTGAHTVGDLSCAQCGSVLGWKYVSAEEEAQRYKVGKFILETKRVCRGSAWEGQVGGGDVDGNGSGMLGLEEWREEEEVEFDSQDEDECEDLFMGVWTPQLAVKRRRARRFVGRSEDEED